MGYGRGLRERQGAGVKEFPGILGSMLPNLRKLFGLADDPSARVGTSGSVREIADALDRLPPDRARHLAGFAYVLGRVAHADLDVSPEETRAMERILIRIAGLSEEEAILIVRIAKSQHELFGSTESYVVTREFARIASEEEKMLLLECLFAVSASDQEVSGIEEAEIRRIAGELAMSHADFIAARSQARRGGTSP
jgi:uncharacterized tellurite resistance protein B-like protein